MTNDRSNSHERALLCARLRLHLKPEIRRSRSRDKARQPTPLEAPKPAPNPDIDVPQSVGFDVIGYAVVENAVVAADIQGVRCDGSRQDSGIPTERSQPLNDSGEVMATSATAECVGEDVLQQQAQWVLGSENKLSRGDYHLDGG
ncbi:similar to An12g04130 [Aspergillus luchuensis]|uniref:Similar to An12g04130 n=1 Tax=Aspergillus kawachii TaxID=1069201 RepID=A0A146FNC1_ASPKA|nr:similar to An12g04130 [Aspergillus luchuensis]